MGKIKKTTQHIGSAGELLVQYKLVKFGIDSAAMTTDSGIDLVAYSPKSNRSFTIQVKTKEKPVSGGGTGKMALAWDLRDDSAAELVAITDLSTDSAWLFTHGEFEKFAQQHSAKGNLKLYMYVDETVNTKKEIALLVSLNCIVLRIVSIHFFNYKGLPNMSFQQIARAGRPWQVDSLHCPVNC